MLLTKKNRRIERICKDIDEILCNDWDPIGIKIVGEAVRNEYHNYIYGVFRLLENGANANELAKYLADIEVNRMGISSSYEKLLIVVKKLMKIDLSKD
jgi:hypothetical protein